MYMNAFQILSNSSHFYNLLVDNVCGAPRTTAAAKSYVGPPFSLALRPAPNKP